MNETCLNQNEEIGMGHIFSNSKHMITGNKVLTSHEQESLTKLLMRYLKKPDSRRDVLMILLALEGGLRAQEILNLKIKHFKTVKTSHMLHVESLKGSNPRDIWLRDKVGKIFLEHILKTFKIESLQKIDRETLIFDVGYHRLRQVWHEYKPFTAKNFHSLRHTFAVNLFRKTKDLHLVKIALGHRSIMNTMVYMDFCYTEDHLRKAMTRKQYEKRKKETINENERIRII